MICEPGKSIMEAEVKPLVIKGRCASITDACQRAENEARELGMVVNRIVGHRAPDGQVEFSAELRSA